ncbi:3-hydroxybutyryl-CoA dehydrogenase [Algoriella xinjiangensis]|uniref:3-hydroxybutyryl-CoA dehydrogenase n=1 Tax=Algoriella xinjiangensis TaxID=684065 RepID=A0A1I4S8T5_9FLAO|nr:3-hydroxyacyl-CoA dehydrogenase NAD-binding domain-containing protein [Algoriella xinjiangensis]SFM60714.1 3-hydroxybutyryl-CoA dehydrogenase [Algoriella xinjiangensis]VDH15952.1 Probable 3-hydroxybutyryl-CoA dehydrogenase [Algoriella xinjiangensis]
MKKIGIIGGGAMGSGIAQVFAQAGHSVVLYDTNQEALDRSKQNLANTFVKLVAKEKYTAEQAETIQNSIEYAQSLDAFATIDLMIEAIVENLDVKKSVFKQVEAIVSEDCILASNTSSLSIASIASSCENPSRVIGIHFFNPAPLMALVEIIPAVQTREGLAEEVKALIQSVKKLPVITKDTPGFIVNRVARPFYGEAIRILEEGVADAETIDFAMTSLGGFRMGPFELMDFIGHDVNYRVTESVFEAFFYDPRFKPSFSQKRLFEAGYYGRKSGRGFYNYAEGAEKKAPNQEQALLEKIYKRILLMLINEAADALFLNIANREDLDTAMTKGVNYPKGLLKWADEYGLENVQNDLDELYNYYHEDRYRLSPIIRNMVKENKSFY